MMMKIWSFSFIKQIAGASGSAEVFYLFDLEVCSNIWINLESLAQCNISTTSELRATYESTVDSWPEPCGQKHWTNERQCDEMTELWEWAPICHSWQNQHKCVTA